MRKWPVLFALLSTLSIMKQARVLLPVSLTYLGCRPYFLNCKRRTARHGMFVLRIFLTLHLHVDGSFLIFFFILLLIFQVNAARYRQRDRDILGVLDSTMIGVPSLIWPKIFVCRIMWIQWFIRHPQNTHQEHLRCSQHIMKTFYDWLEGLFAYCILLWRLILQ